jgi:hypothetical protein
MRTLSPLLAAIFFLSLSGCFEKSTTVNENGSGSGTDTTSLIGAGQFAGATLATNKVTGIEVKWVAATAEVSAYRIYRVIGTKLNLLASVGSTVTAFIDGTVNYGSIYTYIVRAVDKNGVEDTNTAKVSSLAWAGISSVTALSRTSLQVTFANSTAAASEIRIYLQSVDGGPKTLAQTVSGSDTTVTLSGLKTGYKYIVSAQAFISSLNKEDGNTAKFPVATVTLGYDSEGASPAKWMNVVNVRAFGRSPIAPLHPSSPERTPRTETVELAFNAFTGLGSDTVYVVTRASVGETLDTSVTTPCTSSIVGSCRVKCTPSSATISGIGVVVCRDLTAAASPARYRYTMSVQHTEGSETWVEPVPADRLDLFSILVPIPPDNMVLVQRDAVNFEMCGQMNATPDPFNHNRCPYTGIGAVPFNSGPGKPTLTFDTGYYDFGYNLFEDRFPQGCKWTTAAAGGKCGAGATAGDCIGSGTGAPSNTIGVDGNVYQLILDATGGTNPGGICYYKYNGTWTHSSNIVTNAPNPSAILGEMWTSDPQGGSGRIMSMYDAVSSQAVGWLTCAAQADPNYGAKRLPRMREFRAFNAFPTNVKDSFLYGVTTAQANTLISGGGFNASTGYRCPNNLSYANYVDTSNVSLFPTSLAQSLTSDYAGFTPDGGTTIYGNNTFWLDSAATVDCQSRYGAQNNAGLGLYMTSDLMSPNPTTKIMTGLASAFDSGNRDLLQDLSGGLTGVQIAYSTAATDSGRYYFPYSSTSSTSVNYVAIPLGVPILSSSSSVYLSRLLFVDGYAPRWYLPLTTANTTVPTVVEVNTRWGTRTGVQGQNTPAWGSLRCVMSAD